MREEGVMFDDERSETMAEAELEVVTHGGHDEQRTWREVDRGLRACARRRCELDAEEARWLVAAGRLQIHRQFGCASIHEYLERRLGYGPRAARNRLRVARALGELPAMTAALARGELCHSAVRELTRVATPATEAAWIEATKGRCLREIEAAVSGHERGDRPDDPADAEPKPMTVELELSATTLALYHEALRALEGELGEPLTDDQAVALMCRAVLDGNPASTHEAHDRELGGDADDAAAGRDAGAGHDAGGDGADAGDGDEDGDDDVGGAGDSARDHGDDAAAPRANRPPYQIAITVCDRCQRTWRDAAGHEVRLTSAASAQAQCDAELLGRVDGTRPARATRTIPPAIRRQVFRRDRGRCIVPGCRAARFLEVHHVVPRAHGGDHDPRRLGLLCSGHHHAVHAGLIEITGEAPSFSVRRVPAPASARPARPDKRGTTDSMTHGGRGTTDSMTHGGRGTTDTMTHGGRAATDAMTHGGRGLIAAEAIAGLHQMGFGRPEATRAVHEAMTETHATTDELSLQAVLVGALRNLRTSRG